MSARQTVESLLARIASIDPRLRSVLEVNPDALAIAEALDREPAPRGPLHGLPILVKDNIDTADREQTTAGSLALVGVPVEQDATVVERLRAAGAIVLGKTNLSEWANWRSTRSSSGWSARGRQTRNPYVLDRSPGGSSAGSAVAVAAGLAPVALGTETDGSIVSPSSLCGVVGIKPTVGLTSRAGVVPISRSQDTVGPHARTVGEAAAVLGALIGPDPRDPVTAASAGHTHADYTRFLDRDGLRGARLGVVRPRPNEHVEPLFATALEVLRAAGARLTDNVEIPGSADLREHLPGLEVTSEGVVLQYEFKAGIAGDLATRPGSRVTSLTDLIRFNREHAADEMPYFGQELFEASEARGELSDELYLRCVQRHREFAEGFARLLSEFDALVAPSRGPAWAIDLLNGDRAPAGSAQPAAVAGFPLVTVPAGFVLDRLPVGLTFMGPAWSEPTLIRLAYAFEQAAQVPPEPRFLSSLDDLP